MVSRQRRNHLLSFFFQIFEFAFKDREGKIIEMQSREVGSWQESWGAVLRALHWEKSSDAAAAP